MKDVGITTAEQVVPVGATQEGLHSLSEQLQVDLEEARNSIWLPVTDFLPRPVKSSTNPPT